MFLSKPEAFLNLWVDTANLKKDVERQLLKLYDVEKLGNKREYMQRLILRLRREVTGVGKSPTPELKADAEPETRLRMEETKAVPEELESNEKDCDTLLEANADAPSDESEIEGSHGEQTDTSTPGIDGSATNITSEGSSRIPENGLGNGSVADTVSQSDTVADEESASVDDQSNAVSPAAEAAGNYLKPTNPDSDDDESEVGNFLDSSTEEGNDETIVETIRVV